MCSSVVRLRGSSAAILQLTEQALNKHGTRTTGPHAMQRNNTHTTMGSVHDELSLVKFQQQKHMWLQ